MYKTVSASFLLLLLLVSCGQNGQQSAGETCTGTTCGRRGQPLKLYEPKSAEWQAGERKLVEHIAPALEGARRVYGDQNIGYTEIRSSRISKFLPGWRIYASSHHCVTYSNLWALRKDGRIIDCGFATWTSDPNTKRHRVREIVTLLRSQPIKVEDRETALEVARLVFDMLHAPAQLWELRKHSEDDTVFNREELVEQLTPSPHWALHAHRAPSGWRVWESYSGPPASTPAPRTYHICLDENGVLTDFTMTDLFWLGDGLEQNKTQ